MNTKRGQHIYLDKASSFYYPTPPLFLLSSEKRERERAEVFELERNAQENCKILDIRKKTEINGLNNFTNNLISWKVKGC
jgi:hypothetical protein